MSDREDIQHLDPDQLLTSFSKTAFVRLILASFVLHVILVGGTSVNFVLGMVTPEPEQTETANADGDGESEGSDADGAGDDSATDGDSADGSEGSGDATGEGESTDPREEALEQYNETAPPVSGPGDDLDINMDDL
jgi:hypothetical protein